jgi:zinc transport system substrate-binding protein
MMKKILIALALLSSFVVAKEVTVSILPQKFFVEKIAGDKIDVNVMVKPGASPASYEPKTSQMKKLSNSLAYFSIGVPFEKSWLEKFEDANKKMLVVDTTKGIEKQEMQAHEHHDEEAHDEHKHEEDHDEHDHTGLDPHVWLDPILVKKQAENILNALIEVDEANLNALIEVDEANKDFYTKNYQLFVKELDELDKKLESIIEPYEHKAFMVFHPSWGYFAKRYHLEQISIEIQGKEPKPAQLIELVEEAKKHDIKIVFVAPQFSQKGAKTISKSINGNVATINPLSEKWDENLLKVATEIAKSYK